MTQILMATTMLLMDWLVFKFLFMPILRQYKKIRQQSKSAHFVKGLVVDHVQKEDLDGHDVFAPVVRFTAQDGKEYVVESDEYNLVKKRIGKQVELFYEIGNPSNAIIEPESQLGYTLLMMGLILVLMAILNVGVIYQIS